MMYVRAGAADAIEYQKECIRIIPRRHQISAPFNNPGEQQNPSFRKYRLFLTIASSVSLPYQKEVMTTKSQDAPIMEH